VDVPPLQSLPQVPSTPEVPQVSLPETPQVSLQKTPSVQVPSTDGVVPNGPAVRPPSTEVTGPGGSGGSSGAGSGSSAAAGGSAAQGNATARAAGHKGRTGGRPARALTPKQRAARHERRLREAARQLEGCLPALPSFDRQVIVLRGGLHGRRPLSRTGTAQRLNVDAGRVQSAERSGLAGLRKANAQNGCGLRSGVGRNAAARRLADGSVPDLSPLAVAGDPPALVSTDSLKKGRGKVLAKHASGSSQAEISKTPLRAGLAAPSDEGSSMSAAVWVAILVALALPGAGLLLLRRRRVAGTYGDYGPNQSEVVARRAPPPVAPEPAPSVVPPPTDRRRESPRSEPLPANGQPKPTENGSRKYSHEYSFFGLPPSQRRQTSPPLDESRRDTRPEPAPDSESARISARRHARAVSTLGALTVWGATVTVLLGRLVGRRRR
jgi:hypothetical protein